MEEIEQIEQPIKYTTLERGKGESYEDYKIRKKKETLELKRLKKGTLIWNSYENGTHISGNKFYK